MRLVFDANHSTLTYFDVLVSKFVVTISILKLLYELSDSTIRSIWIPEQML